LPESLFGADLQNREGKWKGSKPPISASSHGFLPRREQRPVQGKSRIPVSFPAPCPVEVSGELPFSNTVFHGWNKQAASRFAIRQPYALPSLSLQGRRLNRCIVSAYPYGKRHQSIDLVPSISDFEPAVTADSSPFPLHITICHDLYHVAQRSHPALLPLPTYRNPNLTNDLPPTPSPALQAPIPGSLAGRLRVTISNLHRGTGTMKRSNLTCC
jgi:hypothetical protein